MAKISARGACKLAHARKDYSDDDGYAHREHLVLRSDGKVLRKHDLLSPTMAQYGSRGWNTGSYSIAGSLSAKDGRSILERFRRYAEQRGYALKGT